MSRQSWISTLALIILPACLGTGALCAQQSGPPSVAHRRSDVELVDQHGRKVMFYSGLLKGRVVAINTIFTTCTTVCPIMGVRFAQLSRLLDSEDAGGVMLVSISTDPLVDTPQRLDAWSRQFIPTASNWELLTGRKDEVDTLLKELGLFAADKSEHPSVVLVGDSGTNNWTFVPSTLSPAKLAQMLKARKIAEAVPSDRSRR